jgi:hypothetical protein
MFARPGTLLRGDVFRDGGTTVLEVREATGGEHRIRLSQQRFPSMDQGRLHIDEESVPPRSELERQLLDFLRSLSGSDEAKAARDHLITFVLSKDYETLSRLTGEERRQRVLSHQRARRKGRQPEPSQEEIIRSHGGLSTAKCTWVGCENRALADMAVCIEHAHPRFR